jgi:hypothetical protein
MIKNPLLLEAFEHNYARNRPVDVEHNFKVANALLDHARQLGVFPPKNLLIGLEDKIKFARAINAFRPTSK